MRYLIVITFINFVFLAPATAKGLAGWFGDRVGVDLSPLDDAHRQLKDNLPIYKQLEEGGSKVVRKFANEINGEIIGNFTEQWIRHSRDEIRRSGTKPLPLDVKAMLYTYFDKKLVDTTQYSIGGNGFFNVATSAFNLRGRDAIVLIDTIVLRDKEHLNDPFLMAHEFQHVVQYKVKGLTRFAKQYVKQYDELESEADEVALKVVKPKYGEYGVVESFASTAAQKLYDNFEGDSLITHQLAEPRFALFACRLNDGIDLVFDYEGNGFPAGQAYNTAEPNCYARVGGLGSAELCLSQYDGKLRNGNNISIGQCDYTGSGFFLPAVRYSGMRQYYVTINGSRYASPAYVNISRNLTGPNEQPYDQYSYNLPDGENFVMYLGEDTGDGLYYIPEEDWGSDKQPMKIIDYFGSKVVDSKEISSKIIGKKTIATPVGSFSCYNYSVVFKKNPDNYRFETCITPGIGEIKRTESFLIDRKPRKIQYILASL